MIRKSLISFFLIISVVVWLIPKTAYGVGAGGLSTTMEGKRQAQTRTSRLDLRDMESTSNLAEGWTWDSEKKILTLENINFVVGSEPSAIRMNSGTIVLKGTNKIICTYDDGKENKGISAVAVSGISAYNSSLIFEGTGSLDVSTTAYGGDGISTWHGSVTINNGDITATGGTSIRYNGCSSGIYTGALYMNGGTLKATGKSSAGTSYGVYAYPKGIEITGGTIQASSGPSQNGTETDIPSTAIYADDIELNESVIQSPAGGKIATTKTPRTVMEYIASSNGSPATNVSISGSKPVETPLSPPVISLTTSNTIAEGESTAVTWNSVEGAVHYYITIENKTAGTYFVKDTIVNGTSYALYGPSLGEGAYEITVQAEGANGQKSLVSNRIILTVKGIDTEDNPTTAVYNVELALKYAKEHWNDSKGACAEFISRCVIAGGIQMGVETGTGNCWRSICKASGLSMADLNIENGKVLKNRNKDILQVGDVVVQWCYDCNISPHILLCGGYNSTGEATFYAHNKPKNNEVYSFSPHTLHLGHTVGAKVIRLSTLGTGSETEELPFVDATSSDWFYPAVQYVYENSIMNGTSATTFAPNGTVERSQVVQMLYNLEGQPTVTGNSGFSDIKSDDWYSKAVTWAERTGVVDGYENNAFRPGKAVSREEFAQMLYNYSKYKRYDLSAAADLSEFPDGSSVSNWANSAVAWANGNGLINGHDDGRLDPSGTAIRAQAASILMGFDRKYVTE